jgi:hypothetical protein
LRHGGCFSRLLAVDFDSDERQSAYRQHGLPVRAAMELEWANRAGALAEAIQGAGRFASAKGRHGAFDDI